MISAVIPAFNEERGLAPGVRELLPVLDKASAGNFEVVIVDDGSNDGTGREIAALSGDSRIRALGFPRNRGKGAALRAGVAATLGELVLICDADMATPPSQLPRFVDVIKAGADLVVGSRRQPGAEVLRAQSVLRTTLGRMHTRFVNGLLGASVSDYTCGFKLFRGDVARRLFAECRSDRWGYDAEILTMARLAGLRIRELPVQWRDGSTSRVRVLPSIVTTLAELIRIWLRYRRYRPGTRLLRD